MIRLQSTGTTTASEPIVLDPALDFMRLLWNIEHGLQSRSKWMETTLGITGPQRLVLRIVRDRPGLAATELAHILHLHPSTITGILQRLVSKGLLQRTRDSRDRRRVQLRVLAAAERFKNPSSVTVEAAVKRVLASFPSHRIRHARDVLAAVADSLLDMPERRLQSSGSRSARSRREA
jgi:MarR family transcriptional regulator, organic hydroperoxide resistance regulator